MSDSSELSDNPTAFGEDYVEYFRIIGQIETGHAVDFDY
jgi:hypothetical protein